MYNRGKAWSRLACHINREAAFGDLEHRRLDDIITERFYEG